MKKFLIMISFIFVLGSLPEEVEAKGGIGSMRRERERRMEAWRKTEAELMKFCGYAAIGFLVGFLVSPKIQQNESKKDSE